MEKRITGVCRYYHQTQLDRTLVNLKWREADLGITVATLRVPLIVALLIRIAHLTILAFAVPFPINPFRKSRLSDRIHSARRTL